MRKYGSQIITRTPTNLHKIYEAPKLQQCPTHACLTHSCHLRGQRQPGLPSASGLHLDRAPCLEAPWQRPPSLVAPAAEGVVRLSGPGLKGAEEGDIWKKVQHALTSQKSRTQGMWISSQTGRHCKEPPPISKDSHLVQHPAQGSQLLPAQGVLHKVGWLRRGGILQVSNTIPGSAGSRWLRPQQITRTHGIARYTKGRGLLILCSSSSVINFQVANHQESKADSMVMRRHARHQISSSRA